MIPKDQPSMWQKLSVRVSEHKRSSSSTSERRPIRSSAEYAAIPREDEDLELQSQCTARPSSISEKEDDIHPNSHDRRYRNRHSQYYWAIIFGVIIMGLAVTIVCLPPNPPVASLATSRPKKTSQENTTSTFKPSIVMPGELAKVLTGLKTTLAEHAPWSRPVPKKKILVSVQPRPRTPSGDPEEKFIGYYPHSGYHNQRAELVNAMVLAHLVNRTLLLPPIWMGWPAPWAPYVRQRGMWRDTLFDNPRSYKLSIKGSPRELELRYTTSQQDFPRNWTSVQKAPKVKPVEITKGPKLEKREPARKHTGPPLTAADCKSYEKECRGTYNDTFFSWDALVDLDMIDSSIVRLVDRWDPRDEELEKLLHVTPEDVFVFDDAVRYELQFVDNLKQPDGPMPPLITDDAGAGNLGEIPGRRWRRQVSIEAMRLMPQKVLLMGTLYAPDRIEPYNEELSTLFDRATAFSTPWIIEPADEIADRMGGLNTYVGVHARIAEKGFAIDAHTNMEQTWRKVVKRLYIDQTVVDEMWVSVKPGSVHESGADRSLRLRARATETKRQEEVEGPAGEEAQYKLNNLKCRGALHPRDSKFSKFNIPVYIATDAPKPTTDPALAIFRKAFPCTFFLEDFSAPNDLNGGRPVEGVEEMNRLVNEADDLPLGRTLMPFLEATIAAKARYTLGTSGSSFSNYAKDGLHQAYHSQDSGTESGAEEQS